MSDASELLAALEQDSMARLKWRVLALLGVSPLSLRGRLLTRRRALRLACHLALDAENRAAATAAAAGDAPRKRRPPGPGGGAGENPNFDMARYLALGGLSDGV